MVLSSWTVLRDFKPFHFICSAFLVRSGILVSVHAFASDQLVVLYILTYLVVVIGGSLASMPEVKFVLVIMQNIFVKYVVIE